MAETFHFELVSPETLLISEQLEMVVVPGADGDLGVLPGHSPLIANVRPGVIDVHEDGKLNRQIFIAGGFCEISAERCTVLAVEAMPVSELDHSLIEARRNKAKTLESDQSTQMRKKADVEFRIAEAMKAAISK